MLLLSVSEFRANISKYLTMALTEKIAIRSKKGVFDITLNEEIKTANPSPSNDPWFDVPENVAELNRRLDALDKCDISKLPTWDSVKEELGL